MENIGIVYASAIYLLMIVGITLYSRHKETSEDFLIASRKMGWFSLGLSIFASMISAYNIVISLTFAYFFGIYMMLAMFGVVFANVAAYYLLADKLDFLRKKRVYSIVDYVKVRSGTKFALSLNFILLFVMFFFIVLQIKINALVFSQILGWNLNLTAIGICLIVLLYSIVGGFKTIVKTDVFQGIFMLFIVILAVIVGFKVDVLTDVASSFSNTSILFGAVCLMVLQFLGFMVQPDLWQRYVAAKDKRELKGGMIFSAVLFMGFIFVFVFLASGGRLLGIDYDPNNLFYGIVSIAAPSWLLPILVVALFSAFMSSLDSALFVTATQFANQKFGWVNSDLRMSLVNRIKLSLIVLLVVATLISLLFSDFLTAVFGLFSIMTIASLVFIFSVISKAIEVELIAGLVVGTLVFLYSTFFGVITTETYTSLIPAVITLVYLIIQRVFVLAVMHKTFK